MRNRQLSNWRDLPGAREADAAEEEHLLYVGAKSCKTKKRMPRLIFRTKICSIRRIAALPNLQFVTLGDLGGKKNDNF